MNVLKNFDKLNNKLTNLLEENNELKQQHKNVQEENQELKEKLKDRENISKENEQLEMISQSLEKTLGKLGLSDSDSENDIKKKNKPLIDKSTTFPLIDDNDDSIQTLEDSSKRSSSSFNKGI